jgi:hypothetical protein
MTLLLAIQVFSVLNISGVRLVSHQWNEEQAGYIANNHRGRGGFHWVRDDDILCSKCLMWDLKIDAKAGTVLNKFLAG